MYSQGMVFEVAEETRGASVSQSSSSSVCSQRNWCLFPSRCPAGRISRNHTVYCVEFWWSSIHKLLSKKRWSHKTYQGISEVKQRGATAPWIRRGACSPHTVQSAGWTRVNMCREPRPAPGKPGPQSYSAPVIPQTWSLSGISFLVCKIKCWTSRALLCQQLGDL